MISEKDRDAMKLSLNEDSEDEANRNAEEVGARCHPGSRKSSVWKIRTHTSNRLRQEDDEPENPDFEKWDSRHEDDQELRTSRLSPRPIR